MADFSVWCGLLLIGAMASFASSSQPNSGKPNILFILADDLGYGDLDTYPNPVSTHGRIATPHLNSFAQQSMQFSDAYAGAPVCAPSRCTLMTGKHTGHCTVRSNGPSLNASDVTVAHVLKEAGYHTALVGKWGLGSTGTVGSPNNKSFDFFFGYTSQENAHNYYPPFLWMNADKHMIPENEHASPKTCGSPLTTNCVWAENLFVNTTISLLTEYSKDTSTPFYLFLSFTTPHAGAVGSDAETGVPAPDVGDYTNSSWPDVERHFASVITKQDEHVGMVLSSLESLGLAENTVVFYASDNGAHNEGGHNYEFFGSSGPLRGFKRSLHEGGIRSPLLVRWPGVVKENSKSDHRWGFFDFMATAADLAGVESSSLPAHDGASLVPTLKGTLTPQPEFIYHEYCHPNENRKGWGQSVRFSVSWKAVRYDNNNTSIELYDLDKDLGETTDVAKQNPEAVNQAITIMEKAHVNGNYCNGH